MSPFDVIKTVRLTEKVMAVNERNQSTAERLTKTSPRNAKKPDRKYQARQLVHLAADSRADKKQIRRAVEYLFKVKVDKVSTLKVKGKVKRNRYGYSTKPTWKKAYVRLEQGQDIDFASAE